METPPFPLVEQFYECTAEPINAFQDALGIAVGNAAFWVPLILCIFLPLVYLFLNFYKDAPSTKLEYCDEEMEEAARHMGLLLLRTRDGYFQTYSPDLAKHYVSVIEALKSEPILATDKQISKAMSKKSKSCVRKTESNSDDSLDPIDDIA